MKVFLSSRLGVSGLLLGLFVTALLSSPLLAVDCSQTDITLSFQADIDDFQNDYGPCDRIVGGLTIDGAEVTNVDGLSELVSMGNLSFLFASELTSTAGLSNLTSIDGSLFFTDSNSLTSVDGLAKLTSVGGTVRFSFMEALTNLDGLSALSQVGSIFLEFNTELINVDGFSSIQSVGNSIHLESNIALLNLDGFSSLSSTGVSFTLLGHTLLTNIDGLASLISVGENFRMEHNPLLAHCRSLVRLLDNTDHADPGPGPGRSGVPDVGDAVILDGNPPGCNSIEEILNAQAEMDLTKTSTTKLVTQAGQIVHYDYGIINTSQATLHDVSLTDDNVDATPVCAFAGNNELAPAGNPGSTVRCTAQHTVTLQELAAGGTLDNTATVTSDEAPQVQASLSIPFGIFSDGFESPDPLLTCPCWNTYTHSSLVVAINAEPAVDLICQNEAWEVTIIWDFADQNPYLSAFAAPQAPEETPFCELRHLGESGPVFHFLDTATVTQCKQELSGLMPMIHGCL